MARQDSPSDFNYVNELSEPIHGEPVQGVDLENNSSAFQPQDDSLDAPLLPLAVDGINRGHVASTKVATKDKGWAIAFKINVVVTVIAAVCFGKLAIDAVANDSLSGAGRRRLQLHGDSDKSYGRRVFGAFHVWHFFILHTSTTDRRSSSFPSSFHRSYVLQQSTYSSSPTIPRLPLSVRYGV